MTDDWQDLVVGARMSVDSEFSDRVRASSLSNSQWGLVMTAVEFDVEDADDPEHARIVADTSQLEHVLPEMQNVDQQQAMGAGGRSEPSENNSGIVGGIKAALGLGSDDDGNEELEAEAVELADEYANELQSHLEKAGRWDEVRRAAAGD